MGRVAGVGECADAFVGGSEGPFAFAFDVVDSQDGDRAGIVVSFGFDVFLRQGTLALLLSERSRLSNHNV